ncbi:MAG: hypothetical protein OHK0039_00630 [Bacteroidia bacterium]
MLSLTLLLPLGIGVLQGERYLLRRQVRQGLARHTDRSQLVYWRFSRAGAAALRWERDDEFAYEGVMYDVVARSERGDSLHLWCWPDLAETALDRRLQSLVQDALRHNPRRQQRQRHLLHFLQLLYCQDLPTHRLDAPPLCRPQMHDRTPQALGPCRRPAVPPPEGRS